MIFPDHACPNFLIYLKYLSLSCDIDWLKKIFSLEISMVWTITSQYVFTYLRPYIAIFTFCWTWTIKCEDINSSCLISSSNFFLNDYLWFLSFLIWVSRLWLSFTKWEISSTFHSTSFWCLSFSFFKSIIFSINFWLSPIKCNFSSSFSKKLLLNFL